MPILNNLGTEETAAGAAAYDASNAQHHFVAHDKTFDHVSAQVIEVCSVGSSCPIKWNKLQHRMLGCSFTVLIFEFPSAAVIVLYIPLLLLLHSETCACASLIWSHTMHSTSIACHAVLPCIDHQYHLSCSEHPQPIGIAVTTNWSKNLTVLCKAPITGKAYYRVLFR